MQEFLVSFTSIPYLNQMGWEQLDLTLDEAPILILNSLHDLDFSKLENPLSTSGISRLN